MLLKSVQCVISGSIKARRVLFLVIKCNLHLQHWWSLLWSRAPVLARFIVKHGLGLA